MRLPLAAFRDALPPGLRRLLPPLLVLAVMAELFAYAGLGAADRATAARALALADQVRNEDLPLTRWLHELNAGVAQVGVTQVGTGHSLQTTDFLNQVGAAVVRAGVRVARLAPRPGEPKLLDVELIGAFPDFLRFAASMEKSQGKLRALQMRQAESAPGRLAVSFLLKAPSQAGAAAPDPDDAKAAGLAVHNPFAPASGANAGNSPQHRLTGITRLGTRWMATIDGRDYQEGDPLVDAVVARIYPDEVLLTAGPVQRHLGFAASR